MCVSDSKMSSPPSALFVPLGVRVAQALLVDLLVFLHSMPMAVLADGIDSRGPPLYMRAAGREVKPRASS